MTSPFDVARNIIRKQAEKLAGWLDRITKSRLTPNQVTTAALLLHLPVMYAITTRHFTTAAALLVVFGLFDTLDGSLARLQKRVTKWGMVYDSVSDRIKESGIYLSLLYIFLHEGRIEEGLLVAALMAASIIVSYVKSAGGIALNAKDAQKTNRTFAKGLMRYEIRMAGIVLALLSQQFMPILSILLVLTVFTVYQRFVAVYRGLDGN